VWGAAAAMPPDGGRSPRDPAPERAAKRRFVDRLDFVVDVALGPTIRGRFDRVAGWYEDGARMELTVDVTSVETGNVIWDGLLRSAGGRRLTEQPQVRFTSTRIRELEDGTLRVEGRLDAAGTVEPVAFDAVVKDVDHGLQLATSAVVDRQQLGKSAHRLAAFLPATVHVTMHLSR